MNHRNDVNPEENAAPAEQSNAGTLNVRNPFDKDDDKQITQEDVDREQTFKEAQTERD